MQASERDDFAVLLTDALGYYGKDATDFTLDVWWAACQRFTLEQVGKALQAHAMDPDHGQFAPKVADIVRVLGGTRTDAAIVAWQKAYNAMCEIGAYKDVVFDDANIHACIHEMGGWPKLCRLEGKDLSYAQHRFAELYKSHATMGCGEYPPLLRGERDVDEMYARRGLPPPKPTVIGNVDQARLVYAGAHRGGEGAMQRLGIELPRMLKAAA